MSINETGSAHIAQALNNADVRAALVKKGLEITEKSIFKVTDKGIQVDVEGDGVYDKTISGLLRKDGSVNTNHKKYDIDDTAVNTSYIKQQNAAMTHMRELLTGYDNRLETLARNKQTINNTTFDEEGKKAEIERQKAAVKQELDNAKRVLAGMISDAETNSSEWTTKEYKDHQKKFEKQSALVEQLENKFNNFDVDARLTAERQKFEQDKLTKIAAINEEEREVKERKLAQEEKLTKAQGKYNDYLAKHGYDTTEARKEVKDLQYDENMAGEKGLKLNKAETTEQAAIRLATEKFKQANPDVGDNFEAKFDAKTGNVTITLTGDNDSIADFTLSGVYNPEDGTLNFDAKKLNLAENAASTRKLAAADSKLRALESQADAIDYAMEPGKAKAKQTEIDNYILQLEQQGITRDMLKNYREAHPLKEEE